MNGSKKNSVVAGQEAVGGCQKASAGRDSTSQQTASRTPLPFPEWQARRFIHLYLDVQFLAWLAFTYALYGVKTTKLLCHQAASLSVSGQTCTTAAISTPLHCDWAWQVTCSSAAISSRRGWLGAVPGVALLRSHLLVAVKAVMSPFFAAWMMSDYGVGISLVEMILWVAVIFTPVLCRTYIRRPALRYTLVLGHRYAKLFGCWLSLGVVASDHVGLALMGYFMTFGQYAFSGWQNAMTLVPLKMLAVCGLAEWLLICHLVRALRAAYPAVAFSHHSNATLFCMSFVLVYAVPLAITAAVERRHKKQYRLYTASFAPTAEPVSVQQHREQAAGAASTSTAAAASSRLVHLLPGESSATCIDSCQPDSVSSSSSAADNDYGGAGLASARSSMECATDDAHDDGHAAATVEYLKPQLESLLGESSVAQILGGIKTAAAGVIPATGPLRRSMYMPMCTATNASIKVSTDHSNVATLGPLLHASLMSAISSSSCSSGSSASPVVYSACFEGCVQMVALMYALKQEQQQRDEKHSNQMHADTDEAANTLLQSVQRTLTAAAAGGGSGTGSDAHSAAVQVLWADSFAAKEAERQTVGSSMQQQQEIEPAESAATERNTTPAVAPAPALSVVCIKPACLIAGDQQTLHVRLRGSSGSGSSGLGKYRLLAFKANNMLVNQVIGVDMSSSECSNISLPAIRSPGVLHVCLVPLEGSLRRQLSGVMHQPVLVLPAAAAAEVKQLWGTTAEPVVDDSNPQQQQQQQHDQAVQEAMAAISADVAFLLGGSSSSGGGGGGAVVKAGRLSPDKAAVLKHLLVFLAQNGCWDTMKFVVDATATAAAAGQGSTLAIAAEGTACTQELKTSSQDSAAAFAAGAEEVVQAPAAPNAGRKLEHSTSNASSSSIEDRCDACGCSYYIKLSSEAIKTAPGGAAIPAATNLAPAAHAPDISTWQQAAAAELSSTTNSSSMKYSWRHAGRHLLFGFRCPALEAAYLTSVSAQTRVSDMIAAVYYLVMALSFRVLTDDLSHDCSSNARGCVLEGLGRVLYFGLFTLPSLMLVVGRKQLMMSGRRESAALLCEVCLCVLPLLSSLGVIRHGPYITSMYQSNSWHSIIIFWCGMGIYRMGCRQVRARMLLPILVCECVLAIHWCRQIQSPLSSSLLKYGGVTLAASLAGSAFELTSRRRFLLGVRAAPATAAT